MTMKTRHQPLTAMSSRRTSFWFSTAILLLSVTGPSPLSQTFGPCLVDAATSSIQTATAISLRPKRERTERRNTAQESVPEQQQQQQQQPWLLKGSSNALGVHPQSASDKAVAFRPKPLNNLDLHHIGEDQLQREAKSKKMMMSTPSPTPRPTLRPTPEPSSSPSSRPSASPTKSSQPSEHPSLRPSSSPSLSISPSQSPSALPSRSPSDVPSRMPSETPSSLPTSKPSLSQVPTSTPSSQPTSTPSSMPTESAKPSQVPTSTPTMSQVPTSTPSSLPTSTPSSMPTKSAKPSQVPTSSPTMSQVPTSTPSSLPTSTPSSMPTESAKPSQVPSNSPTLSQKPSVSPSSLPTSTPSGAPSSQPSTSPSSTPSSNPTSSPSRTPSAEPSAQPTLSMQPTQVPSQTPTISMQPSATPSSRPTSTPSSMPTESAKPSQVPTSSPTLSQHPSDIPSSTPSTSPTAMPSGSPSDAPSSLPTASPSFHPSASPSETPSKLPSSSPSSKPSASPSSVPSELPTSSPSSKPSASPSSMPTESARPSQVPSQTPTQSMLPTISPSSQPSVSSEPTMHIHSITVQEDGGVLTECQTVAIPEDASPVADQQFDIQYQVCLKLDSNDTATVASVVQDKLQARAIETFLTCEYGDSPDMEVAAVLFPGEQEGSGCTPNNGDSLVSNCFLCDTSFRMDLFSTSSSAGGGRKLDQEHQAHLNDANHMRSLQVQTDLSDNTRVELVGSFLAEFFDAIDLSSTDATFWQFDGFTNTVADTSEESFDETQDDESGSGGTFRGDALQAGEVATGGAAGGSVTGTPLAAAGLIGAGAFFVIVAFLAVKRRRGGQERHVRLDASTADEFVEGETGTVTDPNASFFSNPNNSFFSTSAILKDLGGHADDDGNVEVVHHDLEVATLGEDTATQMSQPFYPLAYILGDDDDASHISAVLPETDEELLFQQQKQPNQDPVFVPASDLKRAMRDLEPPPTTQRESRGYQLNDTIDL